MAIIEMIPREYWAQIKRELNALDPSEFIRLNHKDRARIEAEYDEAIKRRRKETNRLNAAKKRNK